MFYFFPSVLGPRCGVRKKAWAVILKGASKTNLWSRLP